MNKLRIYTLARIYIFFRVCFVIFLIIYLITTSSYVLISSLSIYVFLYLTSCTFLPRPDFLSHLHFHSPRHSNHLIRYLPSFVSLSIFIYSFLH